MRNVQRFLLAVAVASTVGCPRQPSSVRADEEGLNAAGRPPKVRPARLPDGTLAETHRGGLVVFAWDAVRHVPLDRVEVRLYAGERWDLRPETALRVTDSAGTAVFQAVVPGDYAATARRFARAPQAFRVRLAAGFRDTVELELGAH